MSAIGTLLDDLVLPVASWDPVREAPERDLTYVDLSSVDRDAKEITNPQRVLGSEAPSRARQLLRAGDVLVSTVRPNLNAVAQVPKELDGATGSTGFCVLRADEGLVSARYLFHWVRTPDFVAKMVRRATGASYPAVSDRVVKESRVPLPPLPEQRRIAAILDKADAVRRKRQQTLDLADQFLRSAFLDMFGDPVTNPKGWPVKKLGDVVDFVSGGTPSKANSQYWDGEIPWVSPKDMKRVYLEDAMDHASPSAFEATSLHLIPPESVLVVVRGMILAHTVPIGLNRVPIAINQDMKAMLPVEEVDPVFLLFALLSQHQGILSKVGTAAHGTRRLEMRDLRALPIPTPPLPQQQYFRRLAGLLQHTSGTLTARADHANKLFVSLTQRAFRGDLWQLSGGGS